MHTSIAFATDPELMKRLGNALRQMRKSRELRVADVAERTQLNPSTVVRAEAGQNPTLLTLVRLLRCYGALGMLEPVMAPPPQSPIKAVRSRRRTTGG